MISKKGQGGESPSLMLGLVIMILLLVAVGLAAYLIAEKNVDVRARVAFDDFLAYYKNCTLQEQIDCYCDEFDLSLLPKDFHFHLVDVQGNRMGFELYKGKKPVLTATTPSTPLCSYSYSSEHHDGQFINQFTVEPVQELDLFGIYPNYDPVNIGTPEVPMIPGKVMLHRSPGGLCFVRNKSPQLLDISDDQLFSHARENSTPCGTLKTPEPVDPTLVAQALFP